MKIDENCIDHNALKLIEELVMCRYEIIDQPDIPDIMKMTVVEIDGIIKMAEAMKEVLKA